VNPYRIVRGWFSDPAYRQTVAASALFASLIVAAVLALK
jgi:hypothetical protein